MLENFSGVASPTRVEDEVGMVLIAGLDMLIEWFMYRRRSLRGTTLRFGVFIATRLELSELRMSLFFTQSRFFCVCCSPPEWGARPTPPSPGGPSSDGETGLLSDACSRLRFVARPCVPMATAAVDDGGPLPAASSSDSSWHCFLMRSASSSSLDRSGGAIRNMLKFPFRRAALLLV
uniref:Uncharacterized protein n=1 Tax=Anopheles melas TaxID=34690 RepID=A0A182U3R8_9DIPT